MVGGRKRKIEMEKRNTKEQRSVTFSKRRKGLFTKAAELSYFSDAKILILLSSPCVNSTSLYSFASQSSALEIAQSYLKNKPPTKINPNPNPNSKFWWENPNLDRHNDLLARLKKTRDQISACLAKREEQQRLGSFPQSRNPNSSASLLNQDLLNGVGADDAIAVQEEYVYDATENNHLYDLEPLPVQEEYVYDATENNHLYHLEPLPDFFTSWETVPHHDSSLHHSSFSPAAVAAETHF